MIRRFYDLAPLFPVGIVLALLAAFLLTGCATDHTPGPTVYKQVLVPVHAACPKPADKPVVPKHVADEHPAMPADPDQRDRILAAKILELFGYADKADGVMDACSR